MASFVSYQSLKQSVPRLPASCVSVRCQGYENSLAECVIYNSIRIGSRKVATVSCYDESQDRSGEQAAAAAAAASVTSDLWPFQRTTSVSSASTASACLWTRPATAWTTAATAATRCAAKVNRK